VQAQAANGSLDPNQNLLLAELLRDLKDELNVMPIKPGNNSDYSLDSDVPQVSSVSTQDAIDLYALLIATPPANKEKNSRIRDFLKSMPELVARVTKLGVADYPKPLHDKIFKALLDISAAAITIKPAAEDMAKDDVPPTKKTDAGAGPAEAPSAPTTPPE
jgi:hypothetical protein